MNHEDLPSKIPLITSFYDIVCDNQFMSRNCENEKPMLDWMKENKSYKKDKVFQAWLWLTNPELIVRYNEYDFYVALFGTTKPTKKALAQVIDMLL